MPGIIFVPSRDVHLSDNRNSKLLTRVPRAGTATTASGFRYLWPATTTSAALVKPGEVFFPRRFVCYLFLLSKRLSANTSQIHGGLLLLRGVCSSLSNPWCTETAASDQVWGSNTFSSRVCEWSFQVATRTKLSEENQYWCQRILPALTL